MAHRVLRLYFISLVSLILLVAPSDSPAGNEKKCRTHLVFGAVLATSALVSAPLWRQVIPYNTTAGSVLGVRRPTSLLEQRIQEYSKSDATTSDRLKLALWLNEFDSKRFDSSGDQESSSLPPEFSTDFDLVAEVFRLVESEYKNEQLLYPSEILAWRFETPSPLWINLNPKVVELASLEKWIEALDDRMNLFVGEPIGELGDLSADVLRSWSVFDQIVSLLINRSQNFEPSEAEAFYAFLKRLDNRNLMSWHGSAFIELGIRLQKPEAWDSVLRLLSKRSSFIEGCEFVRLIHEKGSLTDEMRRSVRGLVLVVLKSPSYDVDDKKAALKLNDILSLGL